MKRKLQNYLTTATMLCVTAIIISSCSKETLVKEVPIQAGITANNDVITGGAFENKFKIESYSLNGNKLIVSQSVPTTFSGTFTMTQWITKRAEAKAYLVYKEGPGHETIISEVLQTTMPISNGTIWNKKITGTLPAGIVTGKIYLKFEYKEYDSDMKTFYSSNIYDLTIERPVEREDPFTAKYHTQRLNSHQTPPAEGSTFAWYPSNTPMFTAGQQAFSENGLYLLSFQTDGNLVLYKAGSYQVLWTTDTNGKGGRYLYFQTDGNLVITRNPNGSGVVWASDVAIVGRDLGVNKEAYLRLQDDGNLVMEWDGGTFTDVVGSTGTPNGIRSTHYADFKLR